MKRERREERIGVEEREVGERERVRNKFRGTTVISADQDIGAEFKSERIICCFLTHACEHDLGS